MDTASIYNTFTTQVFNSLDDTQKGEAWHFLVESEAKGLQVHFEITQLEASGVSLTSHSLSREDHQQYLNHGGPLDYHNPADYLNAIESLGN